MSARAAVVAAPQVPTEAGPLSEREFAGHMARLAPFECRPTLAVAVSGGRDSLCLALLAARWAAARGGSLAAVTVDHGLRPESADEARQVGRWLAAHGVRHHILRWRGPYPSTGVQAAARQARYGLLGEFCRDRAILHLLVGHQREDQDETVLIRREGASGPDGLAGMAAVAERAQFRILRPLLGVPRARLAATLADFDQPWIDDPTNQDTAMARGRLRVVVGDAERDAARRAAQENASARVARERSMAALAARAVRFHQGGFLEFDLAQLQRAPQHTIAHLLARCAVIVAGRDYPPRGERTRRLAAIVADIAEVRQFTGSTLGGCRVIGHRGRLYMCRELAGVGPAVMPGVGAPALWDRRFLATVTKNLAEGTELRALAEAGWNQVVAAQPRLRDGSPPYVARLSLPALWAGDEVLAVPHLGFDIGARAALSAGLQLSWQPPAALAPAPFGAVSQE